MTPLTCFKARDVPRPGAFARLFGRKATGNCFIEVENLLATRALAVLTAADVENLLSDYVVPRDKANPRLADLYRVAVQELATDGRLVEEDRATLTHLRYVLGLDDEAAQSVESEVVAEIYRRRLKHALLDGHLSDDEKRALEETAHSFGLSTDQHGTIYKEEVQSVVQQAFNTAVADRRLTESEEQRLMSMCSNLGFTMTHDAETQRLTNRFRLLAQIEDDKLPTVSTSLTLQRGEQCHAEFPCRLHEKRTVTRAIRYSGPSGRIRIMKGLSWRYGQVSVSRVTSEELRQIDAGTLYITNKRLLFNGAAKNMNVPFKKIIQFTLYKDGIQIEKDSGRDPYFLGGGDLELLGAILESVLRQTAK